MNEIELIPVYWNKHLSKQSRYRLYEPGELTIVYGGVMVWECRNYLIDNGHGKRVIQKEEFESIVKHLKRKR